MAPRPTAALLAEQSRLAHLLADAYSVSDIESNAWPVNVPESPHTWYDVRPMLDTNEHSGELIDLAQQLLNYARFRNLTVQHPEHSHLVRLAHVC